MKLYYSPGACSLAGHIALIEADMKFDLVKVDLKGHKLEDGRSFRDINPKGYVPALELDDGELLTETVAILALIADRYPALMAPGQYGRYRLLGNARLHRDRDPQNLSSAVRPQGQRGRKEEGG